MQIDALEMLRSNLDFNVKLTRRRRLRARAAAEAEHQHIYRSDPALYARERLGIEWWSKQVEIARSILLNRRTVVYAGHSVGKTHGMGGIVQWHYDCWDPSITLTTAPNWSSIHDLLWGEIESQRPPDSPGKFLTGAMRLSSGPMHYAAGHNAETSSGFQGRHEARVLVILDEAMGIPPFIWEATNAMMTSPDCRVVALGNPTETSGIYYDIRDDPDWNVISISCLDHPNIAAELAGQPPPFPKAVSLVWVQEMIKSHAAPVRLEEKTADCFQFPPGSGKWYLPDDIFRPRVLGQFPKQSAHAIWSEAWLILARNAKLAWAAGSVPEIGCDVARYGDDSTTLYARRGPVVLKREQYMKQGTMETAGRCVAMADALAKEHGCKKNEIPIKVDDGGLGGGVVDRLHELGLNVYGINFGNAAHDKDEYFNRGAEMWFVAAFLARDERLDLSRLDEPTFKHLSAELRARRYKIQSDKTLRVESKDDYIKRVGHSPDDADGLVLAFAPSGLWEVLTMDAPNKPKVDEHKAAMVRQVRDALPQYFPDDEEGLTPQTCGACVNWSDEKRVSDGGTGRCRIRLFGVDSQTAACELFERVVEDD